MQIWHHFRTITSHKLLVMRYCFRIGLFRQGLAHDLSKYSWTEFSKGCRYWQGNRSPNNAEREDTGVSLAWLHHKGRNKHHFEYWIDYGIGCDTVIQGVPVPRNYVAEMVMDRISASRVYLGKAYTDRAPYHGQRPQDPGDRAYRYRVHTSLCGYGLRGGETSQRAQQPLGEPQ